MFSLTPLAAALQGIGFGTMLTALQGLLAVTVAPAPVEVEPPGAHARSRVRRRIRRVWPIDKNEDESRELDDEEALLLCGVI